jgi:hypothetical protein
MELTPQNHQELTSTRQPPTFVDRASQTEITAINRDPVGIPPLGGVAARFERLSTDDN